LASRDQELLRDGLSYRLVERPKTISRSQWNDGFRPDPGSCQGDVVDLADTCRPKPIFVDGGGGGGGVVDRLRFLGKPVHDVQFGAAPDRLNTAGAHVYVNKRAEMWGSMREWLKGGVIPPTPELIADLEGVEDGYVMKNAVDAIQLEKKEDMKKRGLASSDFGDALALTFAYSISVAAPERAKSEGYATTGVRK
jgi:hypothetical protein